MPKRNLFLQALSHAPYGELNLTTPDGVTLHFKGRQAGPMADWQIYDWRAFDDFIARGELGFADAYIERRMDSTNLTELVTYGLKNSEALEQFFHGQALYALWQRVKGFCARNSLSGSRKNVSAHYNLGNDFYRLWLDGSMTYSCALFEGDTARSLEDAQTAKYERILRKLGARAGDYILEIGCGWGRIRRSGR